MPTQQRIRNFLLMAFGYTWLLAGVAACYGVRAGGPGYTPVAALCMLGPALAAVVQWRLIERAPWSALGLHPMSISRRGLLLTTLLGVLIMPMALLVMYLSGDALQLSGSGHVEVSGERLARSITGLLEQSGVKGVGAEMGAIQRVPGVLILSGLLLAAVFAAFTVNLPFMLGEELGWRGFMFEATASWSAAQRILLTGPIWGVWHAPLILMGHNYPGYPWSGIVMMMVFCTALAVLFDWSRIRTKSVWGPCVLHGIINGSAGVFVLFTWDGHPLVASPAGLAGSVGVALLALMILLVDREFRRVFLRRMPEATTASANFVA